MQDMTYGLTNFNQKFDGTHDPKMNQYFAAKFNPT